MNFSNKCFECVVLGIFSYVYTATGPFVDGCSEFLNIHQPLNFLNFCLLPRVYLLSMYTSNKFSFELYKAFCFVQEIRYIYLQHQECH